LKKTIVQENTDGLFGSSVHGRLAGKRASWFDGTNATLPIMFCYFVDFKTEKQIITFFHFVATLSFLN